MVETHMKLLKKKKAKKSHFAQELKSPIVELLPNMAGSPASNESTGFVFLISFGPFGLHVGAE